MYEQLFEQLSTAVARNATSLWVLNVGDLKPYEMSTEFFLTYAYDASKWSPFNLRDFYIRWAQREFDLSASDAAEVAGIVANVTRHNARRKPELWNSTMYSLTHYRECVSSSSAHYGALAWMMCMLTGVCGMMQGRECACIVGSHRGGIRQDIQQVIARCKACVLPARAPPRAGDAHPRELVDLRGHQQLAGVAGASQCERLL